MHRMESTRPDLQSLSTLNVSEQAIDVHITANVICISDGLDNEEGCGEDK